MRRRQRYRNRRALRREPSPAGHRPHGPTQWALIALMTLAALIVIASLIH
jgi:hypothetical protein